MKKHATRNPSIEILTVKSLAEYLHCHPSTLYRLLESKKIPGFRLGGGWRFSRSAVDEWIGKMHSIELPVSRGRKGRPE